MGKDTNGRDKPQQEAGHHHFVLVHGLCHGAWCWYKAATALRRAGHRVTALDMAGCGAHPARVDEVRTFEEYSLPLLDAMAEMPPGERVVLVAHSHGGVSVALAAERFPGKVAAAVFVTASLPAVGRSMAAATTDEVDMASGQEVGLHVDPAGGGAWLRHGSVAFRSEEGRRAADHKQRHRQLLEGAYLKFVAEEPNFFLDTKILEQENPEIPGNPVVFGPMFMARKLYQLSPPEDLTLALSLVRPANRFNEDEQMRDEKLLTEKGYGSVRRVFVVVEDDLGIPAQFQRFMIAQSPGVEVEGMAADGADHMAMLSRPQELADLLVRIAAKCSK